MHLVDDKHLVTPQLWRNARLLHNLLYMLYGVVARGVEFENVERTLLVKRLTTLALVASLSLGSGVLAVDCLGKNAGACGFAHSTRTAE